MSRAVAVWIFAAAAIAAALAFSRWQNAEQHADDYGTDADLTPALVLLGIAGVATVCGTIVYVNTTDEDDTPA